MSLKPLVIVCGIILLGGAARAQTNSNDLFERVELLAANGATQLALRLLDSSQPPVEETENWLRAEQARFSIFRKQGDWEMLTRRLDKVPAELPLIHQHRLFTHAVELLLQSGRGTESREYLRDLVWRGSGDSVQISYWRRLLIRSYLLQDKLVDAQIAMGRYQKEYAPTDQNWSYLYGLTLLKSGSFDQAAAQFSLGQSARARVLRLLSRLRAGIDGAKNVLDQAKSLYNKASSNKDEKDLIVLQRILSVQVEAARDTGDNVLEVKTLEKLFSQPLQPDVELPVEHEAADLWRAYQTLGAELGNQNNLLVGDDEAWLEQAEKIKTKNGIGSRSIYALLAMGSKSPQKKDEFHGLLYDTLKKSDLEYVAISLYTDMGSFASVDDIPHSVRHRVVRYAVQQRDIKLAASMAQDLTSTYAGQSPEEWMLNRANLAIYSGDLEGGERLLRELIGQAESFEPDMANRIVQVLFDLQSVDRYETAYELFQMMQERVVSEEQKREMYFWIGDSLRGMGQYAQAAESYIRSATYGDQDFDIWGQTARYHAAEALTQEGMLEDARKMYEGLLKVTTDPNRVMSLQRKMQDLWLLENNVVGGES
ncbi:MAG: hypothetical protein QNI91_15210 [Arenicellales bacterium]|nr:hypothetical protein [Arenicellales bacterium]